MQIQADGRRVRAIVQRVIADAAVDVAANAGAIREDEVVGVCAADQVQDGGKRHGAIDVAGARPGNIPCVRDVGAVDRVGGGTADDDLNAGERAADSRCGSRL